MFRTRPLGFFSVIKEEITASRNTVNSPPSISRSLPKDSPPLAPLLLESELKQKARQLLGDISRIGKWLASAHAAAIAFAYALSITSVGEVLSFLASEDGANALLGARDQASIMKSCMTALANSEVMYAMHGMLQFSMFGGAFALFAVSFIPAADFWSNLIDFFIKSLACTLRALAIG